MLYRTLTLLCLPFFYLMSCNASSTQVENQIPLSTATQSHHVTDTITLGGGCFWCLEAMFQQLKGVDKVTSGYAGGQTVNPTYKDVCSGLTGHAEVIQVVFDTSQIHIDEILAAFWQAHDPTQLNRQGNDEGTQYRSVIFYHHPEQKTLALHYIQQLNEAQVYDHPIVTQVVPLQHFYPAEDYHQNYFNQNKNKGYCQFVIAPKLEKFKKVFKDKIQ